MSRGAARSIRPTSASSPVDATVSMMARIVEEVGAKGSVADVVVWFADDRWLRTSDGAAEVSLDDQDHPAVRAIESGQPVVDDVDGIRLLAVAVDTGDTSGAVVIVSLEDGADAEALTFEVGAIATRTGIELSGFRRDWAVSQMSASLEFADVSALRFQNETSLHRAVRLGLTDLAELAGSRETQFWAVDGEDEPTCFSQPAGGNPNADRDRAIRRLVGNVHDTTGPIRVPDTASSPHFGWLHDEGIKRFVVLPVRAHDRCYGLLTIVDFFSAAALAAPGLAPGLESAASLFAGTIGASLFHADTHEVASEANARLKETHRRMEAGERDSARYELCRLATVELRRLLGAVASELPAVEEPMPEPLFRERMSGLQEKLIAADEMLAELALLTERLPARLALTSINSVIHQTVAEFEEDPDVPEMRIARRLQGDLPELLLDEPQIANVLSAVLLHGVSGTETREAVIVSRLQKGDVIVEISFPERVVLGGVLESLFQPFQGLVEGTGLPLSLADQVVGEHGGQLRVRSEPGEGLVYWLSLPVADNQDRRNRRADRRGRRDRRDVSLDDAG